MDITDLLFDVGVFALKLLIVLFAVMLIAGTIANAARSAQGSPSRLKLQRLDRRWKNDVRAILGATNRKAALKKLDREARKSTPKDEAALRPRVFVCRFDGNLQASATAGLAEQVTALVQVAEPRDEVVIRLKSPGGLVPSYGHAASQLERLRAAGIRLTVAVDEVAASGGYLMASVADHIIAAPFAIIGSIGVVAQVPNIHRFLKRRDIDIELHTAGRYKRTLTVLGENTDEGREKFKADLARTHELFKAALTRHRPSLDLETVATGEYWYGTEALGLGLVDQLSTSDAYLLERSRDADILALAVVDRRPLADRLTGGLISRAGRALGRGLSGAVRRRLERPDHTADRQFFV